MKKIVLSIMVLVAFAVVCNLLLTSCGGGGGDDGGDGNSPRTYRMNIALDANSYSQTVNLSDLKTNIVSAVSSANWVTLTRQTYTSGSPKLLVEVSENTSSSSRNCDITVTASDGNVVIIHVTQQGKSSSSTEPETEDEYSNQDPFYVPADFE